MSHRFFFVLALVPATAPAQTMVAVADAKYLSLPRYETLSTEKPWDRTPNADGEILVPLSGWQRYRLSNVRTTEGETLRGLVALWKLDAYKGGRYLFVLERLPAVDAKRFRATYKVLDSSPITEATCLVRPLPNVEAKAFGVNKYGQTCYSLYEVLGAPHVR